MPKINGSKFFLWILFATIFCITAKGQNESNSEKGKYLLGVNVGICQSWMSNFQNSLFRSEGKIKSGTYFELVMINNPINHWAGQSGIAYSSDGTTMQNGSGKYTLRLQYLRIPSRLFYFIRNSQKKFRPKLIAGDSLAYLTSGKFSWNGTPIDIKPYSSKIDIAALGGMGISYKVSNKTWLNADVTYNHGFNNVAKREQPINSPFFLWDIGHTNNRSLIIAAGISFKL